MDRTAILAILTTGLLTAALLTGCGARNHIVVGSKNFTEQLILGEIVAQHIEARLHQPVERKLDLGGTLLAHQALLAKDIDMYPEYTGTAFTNVLKRSGVTDPAIVLEQVRAEYSSGFIYLVSRTGITGERADISETALPLIKRMRAHTTLPLAMGFGVSTPEHVAALKDHCEAVVIGSAIVRQIDRDPAGVEALMRDLTRPLEKENDAFAE